MLTTHGLISTEFGRVDAPLMETAVPIQIRRRIGINAPVLVQPQSNPLPVAHISGRNARHAG